MESPSGFLAEQPSETAGNILIESGSGHQRGNSLLTLHSKLLTFGVGMYLSCQVAVSSLFHPLCPSKINHGGLISWESDMPPLCKVS